MSAYDILYQPRNTINSQVATEIVTLILPEAEKEVIITFGTILRTWSLFIDGSSNVNECVLGILLITPTGEIVRQAIKCTYN